MNPKIICLLSALCLALSGTVFAAGSKTYQITGTVVEATGSKVTIEKGTERFEIDIDPATTKGSADLKVGSTVTVSYVMSATKIEASSAAAAETKPVGPRSAPTP
jgi:type 1 fimbria pilin